jgi:hypothetical protein
LLLEPPSPSHPWFLRFSHTLYSPGSTNLGDWPFWKCQVTVLTISDTSSHL